MANNEQAFVRLLTSIPRFDKLGENVTSQQIMDYYSVIEGSSQSDLFMENLIMKRLASVARGQIEYNALLYRVKSIGKLIDQLYDLKYT
ncbi:hypothetical protein SteCoe_12245 [Stentor coeruleus]|uniref:Uncharacterized protein n=1 Tax=Stentor coeruleus TaxID=5963 RepID=A0A1R2CB89_9CILI|nr:hypothetical protein SteCoe_12245 [Stentor coeruleus]